MNYKIVKQIKITANQLIDTKEVIDYLTNNVMDVMNTKMIVTHEVDSIFIKFLEEQRVEQEQKEEFID
jgi:hypothetical protein